jgi:hypothetical protein
MEDIMKKIGFLALFLTLALPSFALPASAQTAVYVSGAMQGCNTNEDCTLVATQCGQACATTPINQNVKAQMEASYESKCGAPISAAGICTNQESYAAACVNNRCTISQAYEYNASAGDYSSPTPEKPVPNAVNSSYYNGIDDTDGSFTAYDLPGDEVHKNIMGQYRDIIDVEPATGN